MPELNPPQPTPIERHDTLARKVTAAGMAGVLAVAGLPILERTPSVSSRAQITVTAPSDQDNRLEVTPPSAGPDMSETITVQQEVLKPTELNDHVLLKYERGYHTDEQDKAAAYTQMRGFVDSHRDIFDYLDRVKGIHLTGIASAEDGEHGEPPLGGVDTPSEQNEKLAAERMQLGSDAFKQIIKEDYGVDITDKLIADSHEQQLTQDEITELEAMASELGMTPNAMIDRHDRDANNPLPDKQHDFLNQLLTDRRGVDVAVQYLEPGEETVTLLAASNITNPGSRKETPSKQTTSDTTVKKHTEELERILQTPREKGYIPKDSTGAVIRDEGVIPQPLPSANKDSQYKNVLDKFARQQKNIRAQFPSAKSHKQPLPDNFRYGGRKVGHQQNRRGNQRQTRGR